MANYNLFKSSLPKNIKIADVKNEAGGKAYSLADKNALIQYCLTGTFNNTFYATEKNQLDKVLELANKCDIEFVAKLAIYSHQKGYMKDTAAILAAVVSKKSPKLLTQIFSRVIDNPKMLRNFVQIIRSGVVGRKSLGTRPKKLIQNYLNSLTDDQLFKADIGNNPSLCDIIRLSHPKGNSPTRNALYGYISGLCSKEDWEKLTEEKKSKVKFYDQNLLPNLVKQYESFKKDMTKEMPDVSFQMLTSLKLTNDNWKTLAKRATWNQIRQNLNTFVRHDVLKDKEVDAFIASKIENPDLIKRSNVFPYQLFSTYINVEDNVSNKIKIALQKAAEISIENVPKINGNVIICLDVSGSMKEPVTGSRGSATSKMRCIDVASLITASIVRKNPETKIILFDTIVKKVNINPIDSVMTNAKKLISVGANGGTRCSAALEEININNMQADVIIYVSDNQSWNETNPIRGETATMRQWINFKKRNPNAKMVAIDIAPYSTTQVHDCEDVLNLGGFSDKMFDLIAMFVNSENKDLLINEIEKIQLSESKFS